MSQARCAQQVRAEPLGNDRGGFPAVLRGGPPGGDDVRLRVATPPPLPRPNSGAMLASVVTSRAAAAVAATGTSSSPLDVREQRRQKLVNIMLDAWKLRSNRDQDGTPSSQSANNQGKTALCASSSSSNSVTGPSLQPNSSSSGSLRLWEKLTLAAAFSDIGFALGAYKGGGLLGPPLSIQQMYNAKVEIMPTQTASEGFEISCGRPGEEEELDSSLQLISKRMQEILSRIEGRCRMSAVRFLGWILGKLWRMVFASIEVDLEGIRRARNALESAAHRGSAVMLLPTHRSHIDYLLMSYIHFGFNLPVPHIASGDNLNIPVIGPLFSYSGAFFLRRSFRGDNLYKKVLYGYLLRKLREGAPVEVFIEGGRTRTGMISDPKLGMILMAVRFVRDGSLEDVTLLPSSIDYERTLETNGHVDQMLGGKKKKESLVGTIQSGLSLIMGGSNHGNVYVNFAEGISVREVLEAVDRSMDVGSGGEANLYVSEEVYVSAVAQAVVNAQRDVSYLSPVAFVAAALLGSTKQENDLTGLLSRVSFLYDLARDTGAYIPSSLDFRDLGKSYKTVMRAYEVIKPMLKKHKNTQKDLDEEALVNFDLEEEARVRLRLRYSCGQLLPQLVPASVVVTAFQSMTSAYGAETPIRAESVLKSSSILSEMVRSNFPGARLDANSFRFALGELIKSGVVCVTQTNEDGNPTLVALAGDEVSQDHLRMLRLLVAPAISACCATLSAVVSLMHDGPFSRDDLLESARVNVINEAINGAVERLQHAGTHEDSSQCSEANPSPESLSNVELRAAIKNLQTMGIVATPCIYGSMGTGMSSRPSLMSIASSRSFASLSSSDEKKSSDSTNSDVNLQNQLEVCSAYYKGDGMKLLEKLSTLQRHLYRDERPLTQYEAILATVLKKLAMTVKSPSMELIPMWALQLGAIALLSGAFRPLMRALQQV
eukprot:CAMPEP_0171586642 /NCGR_PEP_ID=MMETSP0961-20121227/12722_1 /TAXON_ID=87120 /ORGANISM="Aurantiochytrium limacinum, Strain ATCCMYA-1381" /LENGTH=940 /DNA_ID=CAMNT_0012144483 /DNA_START=138 /DNA_END=2957 /DNA_ORIENTATION=+